MNFGDRLKKFINLFYENQITFAEIIDMNKDVLNRYIQNKTFPGQDALIKFQKTGVSLDWLITGKGSMFAKNRVGIELLMKYHNTKDISETPIGRIIKWIENNYGSIYKYSAATKIDNDELLTLYEPDYIIDPKILNIIEKSGCSIEWVVTGDGKPYSNNLMGAILENRDLKKDCLPDIKHISKDELIFAYNFIINFMNVKSDRNENDI
ncbi:MAG: helix-turn-helix domain-containing protein [Candidatus Kapabacteria bacterium]|nr:helix-turn-helix domain-containing protein [Candidatus Kapabacteria bacterium]